MKAKSFTAIYLPDPHSHLTKSGFRTVKSANFYIESNKQYKKTRLERADWLVVETNVLHRHLDYLEVRDGLKISPPVFELETSFNEE